MIIYKILVFDCFLIYLKIPGPMASEEDQDQPGNVPSIVEPGPSTSKSIDIPQPPTELSFNEDPNKIHFGGPVNVLPSVPHSPDTNPGGFHAFVPPVDAQSGSIPTNNRSYLNR